MLKRLKRVVKPQKRSMSHEYSFHIEFSLINKFVYVTGTKPLAAKTRPDTRRMLKFTKKTYFQHECRGDWLLIGSFQSSDLHTIADDRPCHDGYLQQPVPLGCHLQLMHIHCVC